MRARLTLRPGPPLWSGLLLALALLAHAPALPLAAWPALLLALLARRLPAGRSASALRLAGLCTVYALAALNYGGFDATTLRLTLLLTLALKWAESQTPREFALVGAAAVVAVAIGLLQWGDGMGVALTGTAALLLAASGETRPRPARRSLRRAAAGLLAALPLAGVLFLFFPRIPGPLWDIGLSFGLPLSIGLEKSSDGLGISSRLTPGEGQVSGGVSENQPVLVAEFANWVPPTSRLYWRGPVYYDFDGRQWTLDADYDAGQGRRFMARGWTSGSRFSETLRGAGQEVRYRIRLTPHDRLWLYGLDLPARLPAESLIGPDWQVLAHQPVTREIHYDMASWLDWEGGGGGSLDAAQRRRALALPASGNPALRELGSQLRAEQAGDATAIARAALLGLGNAGYRLDERQPLPAGENGMDTFWFQNRAGDASAYASAYAFLMRAAGVPTRLVSGFRGGKLMALTDYVVVKRSHAHAWVEIWDDPTGWRRFDPTDAVAPERFAKPAAKPQTRPAAAASRQMENPAAPARQPSGSPGQAATPAEQPPSPSFKGFKLPDVAGWLARWVLRLDAEAQQQLLGGSSSGPLWAWLLGLAILLGTLVAAVMAGLARWRERREQPATQRAWEKSLHLLARHGFSSRPGECPSRLAERLADQHPAWAGALQRLARAYTDWRYASGRADAPARVAQAARHLNNLILAGVDRAPPPRSAP